MDYCFDHLNFGYWCLFRISDLVLRICQTPLYSGVGFMQNKPNLLQCRINLSSVSTGDYRNESQLQTQQNKPNQTQFLPQKPTFYKDKVSEFELVFEDSFEIIDIIEVFNGIGRLSTHPFMLYEQIDDFAKIVRCLYVPVI